jgi:excinuclease ABC subunit A
VSGSITSPTAAPDRCPAARGSHPSGDPDRCEPERRAVRVDEPSIGLHQRDNARLLDTLRRLKGLGNTVIVVEHDRDTILAADHVIDMGPGAGEHGGYVVAEGPPEQIMGNAASLTGKYLSGALTIAVPARRRSGNGWVLTVRGARTITCAT